MTPEKDGNWDQYKLLILEKLDRLHEVMSQHEERDTERFDRIAAEIGGLRTDIATLKVQAGVWGLVGGAIPVVVALVLLYLERRQG